MQPGWIVAERRANAAVRVRRACEPQREAVHVLAEVLGAGLGRRSEVVVGDGLVGPCHGEREQREEREESELHPISVRQCNRMRAGTLGSAFDSRFIKIKLAVVIYK